MAESTVLGQWMWNSPMYESAVYECHWTYGNDCILKRVIREKSKKPKHYSINLPYSIWRLIIESKGILLNAICKQVDDFNSKSFEDKNLLELPDNWIIRATKYFENIYVGILKTDEDHPEEIIAGVGMNCHPPVFVSLVVGRLFPRFFCELDVANTLDDPA